MCEPIRIYGFIYCITEKTYTKNMFFLAVEPLRSGSPKNLGKPQKKFSTNGQAIKALLGGGYILFSFLFFVVQGFNPPLLVFWPLKTLFLGVFHKRVILYKKLICFLFPRIPFFYLSPLFTCYLYFFILPLSPLHLGSLLINNYN